MEEDYIVEQIVNDKEIETDFKPIKPKKTKTFSKNIIKQVINDLEIIATIARSCKKNAVIANLDRIEKLARELQDRLRI